MMRRRTPGRTRLNHLVPSEVMKELAALREKAPELWYRNPYRVGCLIHEALKRLNAQSPAGLTQELQPNVAAMGRPCLSLVAKATRKED